MRYDEHFPARGVGQHVEGTPLFATQTKRRGRPLAPGTGQSKSAPDPRFTVSEKVPDPQPTPRPGGVMRPKYPTALGLRVPSSANVAP